MRLGISQPFNSYNERTRTARSVYIGPLKPNLQIDDPNPTRPQPTPTMTMLAIGGVGRRAIAGNPVIAVVSFTTVLTASDRQVARMGVAIAPNRPASTRAIRPCHVVNKFTP